MTKIKDDIAPAAAEAEAPAAAKPMLAARLIEDVEVALEAYVGEARLTVAALHAMKPGSSIALDAALNRAVDLKLNGVTIARGELVAVGDNFGVRLTEITE